MENPSSPNFLKTEWKLDFGGYLKLAREYLGYAEDARKEGKFRLARDADFVIDLAYRIMNLAKDLSQVRFK